MKVLVLLLLVSCSSFSPKVIYYANSTRVENQCKGQVTSFYGTGGLSKEEAIKKQQDATGYSKCFYKEFNENTQSLVCTSPTHYGDIYTSVISKCHKFLKDNIKK